MYFSQPHEITVSDILGTLWRYRWRCLATVFVVLCAAVAYAVLVPPVWEASQAIVVRDDAATRFGAAARTAAKWRRRTPNRRCRKWFSVGRC